ncbi:hypothetical protein EMMF5_005876 [Cystobasidiomycetes sp. EMM_F5]
MLALRELGLESDVSIKRGVTSPVSLQTEHDAWNPAGKAICQYLDSIADPNRTLFPDAKNKHEELTLESLADGMLDACLLVRYEISTRPEAYRWDKWIDGQTSKITRALKIIYQRLDPSSKQYQLPDPAAKVLPLGGISIACGCWYLDKRFPEINWRDGDGASLAAWYAAVQKRASWKNGDN